jgi:hypothetical protein
MEATVAEIPEVMVRAAAEAIDPEAFTLPRINVFKPRYDRAMRDARAALSALPIGEMVEAMRESATLLSTAYAEGRLVYFKDKHEFELASRINALLSQFSPGKPEDV